MDKLKKELTSAIRQYGEDHIDIILDTETDTMYGSYHSSNNSFSVTKSYPLSKSDGINLADNLAIGWSEI